MPPVWILGTFAAMVAFSAINASPLGHGNSPLERRQGHWDDQICQYHTELVSNGDPHQIFNRIQLSDNVDCKDGGCSISQSESTSFTIGFSGTGEGSWISGGFDVSESVETGNEQVCNGNAGETVCVWKQTAMTDYSVQDYPGEGCSLEGYDPGEPYTIISPNTDDPRSVFLCVRGEANCGYKGKSLFIDCSCAGGPGADCECWKQ